MNFEIISPRAALPIPLVVHVPHSSPIIPPDVRQTLCLDDQALQRELLSMTDWYTDRLFDPVLEMGGTLFVNRLSRLVVDPERFPDDTQEVMAAKGMGAVYTRTADGQALRKRLSPDKRTSLLETYFYPYAYAFTEVVSKMLERHGYCVILDAHSFPSVPKLYERDQQTERPAICIGTDNFHTPESLVHGIRDFFVAKRLRAEQNRPFAGTYVPLRYWHSDPRVSSVMIEIRRDLYMDEQTGAEKPSDPLRELVRDLIRASGITSMPLRPFKGPLEDFFHRIHSRPSETADFVLDWAKRDKASAAKFVAMFLAKVFAELDPNDHYHSPRPGVTTSFTDSGFRIGSPRRGLEIFCEILSRHKSLTKKIRNCPMYPRGSREDGILFVHGGQCLASEWTNILHGDGGGVEDQAAKKQEIAKQKEERKKERYAASQLKVEQNREASARRKLWREQFLEKPLSERVHLLALDEKPVKVFPIDPNTITPAVLARLDGGTLGKLSSRVSGQRHKAWKKLASRIAALQKKQDI